MIASDLFFAPDVDYVEVRRLCDAIEASEEQQAASPGPSRLKPPRGKRGKKSKTPPDELAYVTLTVEEWERWMKSLGTITEPSGMLLRNTIFAEIKGKSGHVTIWSAWVAWCALLNAALRGTGSGGLNSRVTAQVS
ncbi:MAG TPA: hypothetical protein VNQ76_15330, partial [Planctomicrobium sp.]|nr:hypothetical protein [Planctomicrobium sp.]